MFSDLERLLSLVPPPDPVSPQFLDDLNRKAESFKNIAKNFEKSFVAELAPDLGVTGAATAECQIGLMYMEGRGVSRNNEEAAKWFELAAKHDDAEGLGSLGFMYKMGLGVPQNDKKAVELFTLSTKKDNPEAQCNLGLMYMG